MLTKTEFKEFRKDFQEAMKAIESKYKMDITLENISYDSHSFTSKIKAVKEIDGKSHEQVEFERSCFLFDLKPSDFKRRFKSGNNVYELTGLNTKAPKYPYIGTKVSDGSSYKFQNVQFA